MENFINYSNENNLHQQRLRFEIGLIRINERFVADPRGRPLTDKFYSKYREGTTVLSAEQQEQFEQYKQQVSRTIGDGPRQKYSETVLESHEYGWQPSTLLIRHDATDLKRFFHPCVYTDLALAIVD